MELPTSGRIGWREPALIIGLLSLLIAGAAFGRDLIDFTFAGRASDLAPAPADQPAGEEESLSPPGDASLMPSGPAFSQGVVTITADGIDLDQPSLDAGATSEGGSEFHTTSTDAFATNSSIKGIYQWAEYGAPTRDQCNSGVLVSGEKATSVSFADVPVGTWAFCMITSEGRDAYVVLAEKERMSADTASAEATVFVW
jgi:hypothetical protein